MKRAAGAAVVAAIVTVLFSGCFVLRELEWSKDKAAPGDKLTAKISMTSGFSQDMARALRGAPSGFPFIHVFWQTEESPDALKLANGGKWDTTGQMGGPSNLVVDGELFTVLEDESCPDVPIRAAAGKGGPLEFGSTVVTEDELPTPINKFRKQIEARFPVKVKNGAAKDVPALLITPGMWFDDGDDTPEPSSSSGDTYSCGSPYTSTFLIK